MSPTKTARTSALAKLKNLRPSNPRAPVTVNFAHGRATATLPPGSEWVFDDTGALLWVKLANGLLRCFIAAPGGGAREVTVPGNAEIEAYKKYFSN